MLEDFTVQEIWSEMPDELAASILGELRKQAREVHQELIATTASALRMRPDTIQKQPAVRQAGHVRRMLQQVGREHLCALVLIEWLTRCQKPMLVQFLDELGIVHEEGVVKEDLGPQPEREKLATAIANLRAGFQPDYVRVYLQAFAVTTADEWEDLPDLIEG